MVAYFLVAITKKNVKAWNANNATIKGSCQFTCKQTTYYTHRTVGSFHKLRLVDFSSGERQRFGEAYIISILSQYGITVCMYFLHN